MQLIANLRGWYEQGWLRAIDLSLAEYLYSKLGADAEAVAVLAALVSHQLGHGHPCLELNELWQDPEATLQIPPEHASYSSVHLCASATEMVAALGPAIVEQLAQSTAVNTLNSPLVLQGQERLYLRRYWDYEQQIKQDLALRMAQQEPIATDALRETLDDLFGVATTLSWQRLACAMAVRSGFTVITGGPGTGKTYTVVRLLATLQKHRADAEPLRIRLAAPTGKAAKRMEDSINEELKRLPTEYSDLLTENQAVTLHRLLGTQSRSRAFRHHANNPLLADVVIIDEASMVDIEMMAAITAALPTTTKLILLGDKDQLASVEAGAVLGQLCDEAEQGHYAANLAQWLNATLTSPAVSRGDDVGAQESIRLADDLIDAEGASQWPYLQHTVMLRESRRFKADEGIGKLATEINQQRTAWLREWLTRAEALTREDAKLANIQLLQVSKNSAASFKALVQQGYQPLQQLVSAGAEGFHDDAAWGEALLEQLEQFQMLAALRRGDWGMQRLNELATLWLNGDRVTSEQWFVGRPVMITQNDYSLDLRNGDIGIVVQRRPDEPPRVLFRGHKKGSLRWLLPSRLTHVETAYVMTIHKSQGSEFTHTVVVVPEHDTPLLTKELLYTGITRARKQLTLVCANPRLVLQATQRRILRGGGLT
ncbi:exodeoxyribonuclease V subunit alpha [Pseudidiomarina terrestris]|uniref:exodeoxyribonuclease V subunit alpha n=1 Tax=Pseudidiomarina terrestris TaxID=2820060 RepID=UPI00264B04AD|nr:MULTISPECIES: exodeoxyribonuclease V subunit alpha [unclassified Pseudidiomarina]MDN7135868.1 exodeoxyribonuclease V subunit alpha [Pseudidiomarina sp. 1ASP75-5]MEA3588033.1 exodeoxyribonuclease V subunit alpha [Pseudidiomarina sp. 1APP75-27a]